MKNRWPGGGTETYVPNATPPPPDQPLESYCIMKKSTRLMFNFQMVFRNKELRFGIWNLLKSDGEPQEIVRHETGRRHNESQFSSGARGWILHLRTTRDM